MALFLAGGTGPMLAAVVAAAALDGRRGLRLLIAGLRRWRLGRWYLLLVAPLPVAFVVQAVALSVIFSWAYNATAGSALLAILLHGAINGWYSLVVQGIAPAAAPEFAIGTATITVVLALVLLARYGPAGLAGRSRVAWPEPSANPVTGAPRG